MYERWTQYRDTNYSVCEWGRVRNNKTQRELALSKNKQGFLYVKIIINGHEYIRSVAVMVAETYHGEAQPPFNSIIHLDNDRQNCSAENLKWRPRGYALQYHRQFDDGNRFIEICAPFIELTEKRTQAFENFAQAGKTFGVLDRAIKYNLLANQLQHSQHLELLPVPITKHKFVYL